ncbi:monocarboxylate transporter 4 isoform X2 [Agrilus planipennis]|uniref:Monocarboxylate transporter 4 isoform X2 n=1 Tax=Agrilus planipennis TaxID=224129 RepID=A0A1W4XG00_AGRPL|nr:monocarboxylate transporter 4 isoform X2 [Agrilus planipennis]
MSSENNKLPPRPPRSRKVSRTDSEVACEETARLTAEAAEGDGGEDDTTIYYYDYPPPPDGGYGWVIVFASFMCNMIVDGIAYTFGVFLNDIASHYGELPGKTAWVGSLLSGMYLSAGPLVSALSNKFGCRAVCISGAVISTCAFLLSTMCPTVNSLMLIYGFFGGLGFGLIYLPAVVCVGYYFETKRSLATGIAVCGSGVGTFAFAPLATKLLDMYGWKGANLILAGFILNCVIFGALMRPLEYPKSSNMTPLLQRMAEERRIQMERGSIGGSYFMVQLPDGTMEKRMKTPLNIDPGVHSSLNLDQLAPGTPITPIPTVPTLPTITEGKADIHGSSGDSSGGSAAELKAQLNKKPRVEEIKQQELPKAIRRASTESSDMGANRMPRNASQPAFSTHHQGIPKNGSVPFFDRIRKASVGDGRFKPTLNPIKSSSKGNVDSNGDLRKSVIMRKSSSFFGSKNNNADADIESNMATSKLSLARERPIMVRPMSRKDIFYSGSVINLPEYQSQKSLTNYRQSVLSISRSARPDTAEPDKIEQIDLCPCLVLPESFKSALAQMMDMSLLKDPVFVMIGISNFFGMAGLYVPFVYLVNCATDDGIELGKASFLISVIGITNTFGRIACGFFADFPQVNALLVNNLCLVISTISVALTPMCHTYAAYVIMAIFFGIAISGYISLTSIILVDLLGLDKLTNAFGLLILFRGAAAIVGSPLAGAIHDMTDSYDIPFYVAAALFGVSAITSFIAPCLRRDGPEASPMMGDDQLTPIDEDEEEEDGPITMSSNRQDKNSIPEITHTLPSPGEKEIKQLESVL